MIISVVGLGKIGLPLAAQYSLRGHRVIGVDIDQKTVDLVNSGLEPFPGETGLAAALSKLTSEGRLSATSSYASAIPVSDAVVVVVPLFTDASGQPDFAWMDSATQSIGRNLTRDTLVLYETTLPIGTTRNRWGPQLEKSSGLIAEEDFHLAFSPERVLTGRVFEDLRKYPKLVGGLSGKGASKAVEFYQSVIEFDSRDDLDKANGVWDLGSAEAAEMAKLAETTYRDVNIALANEFASHAESLGVDVYDVISACNSQPYSHIHQPGISVGGHCIPVYPQLYMVSSPEAKIVKIARDTNRLVPSRVVDRIEREMGSLKNKIIGVLGVAYRPGVKETAFSGALALRNLIEERGGIPRFSDPLFSSGEMGEMGFRVENMSSAECVVLHTSHPEFSLLSGKDFPKARVVYDGRNFLTPDSWSVEKFITIGVGLEAADPETH